MKNKHNKGLAEVMFIMCVMIIVVAAIVPIITSLSPTPVPVNYLENQVESLYYNVGYVETGDLEGGTKTISATSEASGTGNADYSSTKTVMGVPPDEVTVLLLAQRLTVTIAAGMTATQVNCRVYIDSQDAAHLLFDKQWLSVGAKIEVDTLTLAADPTTWALLLNGASHTFYFFLWVNSGNCGVTLATYQAGIGNYLISSTEPCMELDVEGIVGGYFSGIRRGASTLGIVVYPNDELAGPFLNIVGSGSTSGQMAMSLVKNPVVCAWGAVATDIHLVILMALEYTEKTGVIAAGWRPGYTDTGDLEAGTKNIVATAEASGVGNADYSAAITARTAPPSEISLLKMNQDIEINVSALTATQLNCRAYLDVQDVSHRLYDLQWLSTGDKKTTGELTDVLDPTLWGLLLDGGAHTVYFFLWVDSNSASVTIAEYWQGIGSAQLSNIEAANCLSIDTGGENVFMTISGTAYGGGAGGSGTGCFRSTSSFGTNYIGDLRTITGIPGIIPVNDPVYALFNTSSSAVGFLDTVGFAFMPA